ncbi:MAG: hypothetical protein NWP87_06825 [Winogradskyella sp.]|nr:hypothetical protein [Winogradskyella sp.]
MGQFILIPILVFGLIILVSFFFLVELQKGTIINRFFKFQCIRPSSFHIKTPLATSLKKLPLLFLVALSLNCFSQTKESALMDAKTTSKATLSLDFETLLHHTLPKVVDLMGGKDAALTLLKSSFSSMKTQGFVFEKADILSASEVVKEQGQYRCIIEGYNQMKMSSQRIKSKSYLLGIYNEADKFWWFIEAKQLKNKDMLDQVLPNFETRLEIPEDDVEVERVED